MLAAERRAVVVLRSRAVLSGLQVECLQGRAVAVVRAALRADRGTRDTVDTSLHTLPSARCSGTDE